mgnify:FL=1
MNEKRSTEDVIKDQLKIIRNSGLKGQLVTISIPIVTQDKRIKSLNLDAINYEIASALTTLTNILGYRPTVLNSTPYYSDTMVTLIVTFLFSK